MELKKAFVLIVVGFCFLIGYGYVDDDEFQPSSEIKYVTPMQRLPY